MIVIWKAGREELVWCEMEGKEEGEGGASAAKDKLLSDMTPLREVQRRCIWGRKKREREVDVCGRCFYFKVSYLVVVLFCFFATSAPRPMT